MSDFHSITPYGSKICHGSVTGVTCDTTHCSLWQLGAQKLNSVTSTWATNPGSLNT